MDCAVRLDDHTKALHDAGCSDGLDPDDVAADDEGLDLEAARALSLTRPFAMTLALHAVESQGVQHSIRRGRCKGAPPMLTSDRAQKSVVGGHEIWCRGLAFVARAKLIQQQQAGSLRDEGAPQVLAGL